MKKILAMILARDHTERMGIICQARPKPLLPFGGGFRLLDFSLSNCAHSLIDAVALVTDYKHSQISEYCKRWQSANNRAITVTVPEPSTGTYRGTAEAIYQKLSYIEGNNADFVIILAGDHIYKMDYRKMVYFHKTTKADVTVAITQPLVSQAAHRFGTVKLNSDGKIVEYIEKPVIPMSNLASMGIYLFNKEVLFDCLGKNRACNEDNSDFCYSVFPGLVKNYKVFAYEHRGYWQDISTMETYFAANMDFLHHDLFPGMNGNWPILTDKSWDEPAPSHSFNSSVNSIIGPGCVIKGTVDNSILSQGVWIEDYATVRNSIVMPNVFVGYHSVVDRCIVDEGVHFSRFNFIGVQGERSAGFSDITVVGKDVIVPPYTTVTHTSMIPAYAVLSRHNGKIQKNRVPISISSICNIAR